MPISAAIAAELLPQLRARAHELRAESFQTFTLTDSHLELTDTSACLALVLDGYEIVEPPLALPRYGSDGSVTVVADERTAQSRIREMADPTALPPPSTSGLAVCGWSLHATGTKVVATAITRTAWDAPASTHELVRLVRQPPATDHICDRPTRTRQART